MSSVDRLTPGGSSERRSTKWRRLRIAVGGAVIVCGLCVLGVQHVPYLRVRYLVHEYRSASWNWHHYRPSGAPDCDDPAWENSSQFGHQVYELREEIGAVYGVRALQPLFSAYWQEQGYVRCDLGKAIADAVYHGERSMYYNIARRGEPYSDEMIRKWQKWWETNRELILERDDRRRELEATTPR